MTAAWGGSSISRRVIYRPFAPFNPHCDEFAYWVKPAMWSSCVTYSDNCQPVGIPPDADPRLSLQKRKRERFNRLKLALTSGIGDWW